MLRVWALLNTIFTKYTNLFILSVSWMSTELKAHRLICD